ncbi:MAG: GNAT family N-acetyltransferase [Hasllibacter sp.]
MVAETVTLRPALLSDLPAVDRLLARSYPALLKADYPPSVLVTAVPRIARARPDLLASGTYLIAEEGGRAVAAGGWSRASPVPGGGARRLAHVRHVATDPAHLRRGLARAILTRCMDEARRAGMRGMACLSTRTAVPFYAALGFAPIEEIEVPLADCIVFPAVRMTMAF